MNTGVGAILIIMMTVFGLLGAIAFSLSIVLIRRSVAKVRVREDYDEDVDEKQTKEEKEAFLKVKEAEKDFLKISLKDAIKDNKKRFVILAVLGLISGLVLTFYFFNDSPLKVVTFLCFYLIMTVESCIDIDTMEIPPEFNIAIAVLGLISIFTFGDITTIIQSGNFWPIINRLIGAACIAVPLIILDLFIEGAFGFGDIKLLLAAGFLLGWKITVIGFFMGTIIGAISGLIQVAKKKKSGKEHVPFGPSLCMGLALGVLYAEPFLNWYLSMAKAMMTAE